MNKRELAKILQEFGIGKLVSFSQIKRDKSLQNCFKVKTTKGKFFIKQYKPSRFKNAKSNFDLLAYLQQKNFPVVRLFRTTKGKPYAIHCQIAYTVWEYFEERLKHSLSIREGYEFGRTLGRLHRLTHNYKMPRRNDYKKLQDNFAECLNFQSTAPASALKVMEYFKTKLKDMRVPAGQPLAACHDEYSTEHVRFRNGKVTQVFDWDGAARDYMFYELGFALTPAASRGRMNFKLFKSILSGYESERKLTKWEQGHLFEAMLFGSFRWFCWANDKEEQELFGWNKPTIRLSKTVINTEKDFYKKLAKA